MGEPHNCQKEYRSQSMNRILKFALVFLVCYGLLLMLMQVRSFSRPVFTALKSMSTVWVASFLPSAEISSQWMGASGGSDMYLVYGNPVLISAAKEEARRNRLQYATLPTRSLEIHLFEMFIVPLFFVVSLFVATPMNWKKKSLFVLYSLLILLAYLLLKLILLSVFEISNARIGVYELEDGMMSFLGRLLGVFSLGLTITLGFALWLLFGFRNSKFADVFRFFSDK